MEGKKPQSLVKIFHSFVTWNIYNYFNGPVAINTPIESPDFVTNFWETIKWKLVLITRRECEEKYVTECILKRAPSSCVPRYVNAKVRLSLINSQGSLWDEFTGNASFYPNTAITFRLWDIYDTTKDFAKSASFYSGNITVKCDFLFDIPLHFRQIDTDADLRALSNDLKVFYMAGNLTDLDLIVGEGTFFVHSAIVKARSPHISHILNEKPHLQEIDFTEKCSISLMKGLIAYWYSGDLTDISKIMSSTTSRRIRNLKQHELISYFDPEIIKISTTFKTLDRSISWVIEDIQLSECLKHLERRIFYTYTVEDLSWKLYFYPKGLGGDSDFISLCIIKEDPVCFNPSYIEVFFVDENGTEYGTKGTITWSYAPRIYEFPKFMTHDEFACLRETLLKQNMLRMGCRITYGTDYVKCNIETLFNSDGLALKKEHPYTNLTNEMKRLLQSGDMSDISLKAGGKLFRVHKAILAARSTYFHWFFRMLECGTSKTDTIILKDIEPEDLGMILKYVYYAEKIELNFERALKLYPVFRKYKVGSLEELCSDYLVSHKTAKKSFYVKDLPNVIKDLSLKRTARRVVCANWDQISKTEGWLKIKKDNKKLISYILSGNKIVNNPDIKHEIVPTVKKS